MRSFALSLVLSWAVLGCATTEPEPEKPALRAADYYPMELGHSWTFRVSPSPPGTQPQRTITIRERGPDGSFLTDAGMRLKSQPSRVLDGERVLLQEPLEVGTSWIVIPTAADVEKYEIIAVGVKKQVTAGFFRDCVRVKIQQDVRGPRGERGVLTGVWTYAPGMGPIHFRQELSVDGAPPRPTAEFELVRFDAGKA